MPLKKAKSKSELQSAISANIRELMADNKKKGKAKGAGGKARSKKQILAIAISAAKGK
jgi:hypothetical protein